MALTLSKILQHETQNIAELLDDQELSRISARCYEEYNLDASTLFEWRARNTEATKIAEQVWEQKSTPWPGASNVKYPLIAGAAMQFAARSYPAIVNMQEIVRAKVTGRDADGQKFARAKRIQSHMNYQLTEQMGEWEEDMDKMLHGLPVLGTFFKKSYFSPIRQRNISDLILPQDFVVNNNVSHLEDARRGTHVFTLFKNQILERQRGGLWLDKDLKLVSSGLDEQGPFIVLEQHRWLDLDEDGYEEPYCVTLINSMGQGEDGSRTLENGEVVRIVPSYFLEDIALNSKNQIVNIKAQRYFSKFDFLPDFCGKFMGVGFGHLLLPINESINTLINQLVDSGTINNLQGGFLSKQLKLKGGTVSLQPGEWKQIDALTQDLRGAILPVPTKEPSLVLFQMLGFLVEAGKQLSSVSEVLSGEQSGVNVPATTTLALIEQGLKVFSAINKRIYRALKQEFAILYSLNSYYLEDEEYFRILDGQEQVVAKKDYAMGDCDIYPVADPASSTDIQKLITAEALVKTIQMPGSGDPYAIMHEYYRALIKSPDLLEKIHPEQRKEQPPPPEVQDTMSKMQERQQKLPAEIEKLKSEAMLNLAKADSEKSGMSLEQLKLQVEMLMQTQKAQSEKERLQLEMQQAREEAALEREKGQMELHQKGQELQMKAAEFEMKAGAQRDEMDMERERMQMERDESDKDRAFTASETNKDRAHGGAEADKDREVAMKKPQPKTGGKK